MCAKGEHCNFAHGEHELRNIVIFTNKVINSLQNISKTNLIKVTQPNLLRIMMGREI